MHFRIFLLLSTNAARFCPFTVVRRITPAGTCTRQVLLCGDFNYGEINWDSNKGKGRSSRKFLNVCQDCFLYQHIAAFTRCRGDDKPSLLDLVFTKNNLDVESIKYGPPIGKSDHCVLSFKFCIDGGEAAAMSENVQKLNYHKGKYAKASTLFESIPWEAELMGKGVETMWATFLHIYNSVVNQCVPVYNVNKGKRKRKWMNMQLLKMIQKKEEAWRRYRSNTRSNKLRKNYQRIRNDVTTEVRRAKFEYEHRLAKEVKSNPKAFFSYARSKTTVKENVLFVKKSDGQLTTSLKETCGVLNSEFQKVFTKPTRSSHSLPSHATPKVKQLTDIDISVDQVKNLMKNLKAQSAAGPDGIHPRVLRECADVLSMPITIIFEHSLRAGILPTDWKKGNITPIFKKGSKTDPLNYRPISLTSVVCKILEKLIRCSIMEHLEENHLLSPHQHGFRSNKSCLTQLLEYLHFVEEMTDNGDCVDAVYLDCSKAFDTVPHDLLLLKLKCVGVDGRTLNWIKDFLTNRQQRVQVKDCCSEWRGVWSGVPQGSVLGPTLFLVYVNDLLDGLRSKGKLFADDVKIYRRMMSPGDRDQLQDDLQKLDEWSSKWKLKFNRDKCNVMHIGRKNPCYNYTMSGSTLSTTSQEKDLGIIISSNMKPSAQVTKAAASANSMLGRIKHTFTCLDRETLPALYKALVRPRMEFAIQAWSPYLRKDISKLERVQRRATKLIPSIAHLTYQERLIQLNMTTLEKRRERGDMIEVFKILKGLDRVNPQGNFLMQEMSSHKQRTRGHSLKLVKPRHRTWKRNQFFSSRVVNAWNKLSAKTVSSRTVNMFKHNYDHYDQNMTRRQPL